MNEFDQFMKHVVGAHCYIRYADDFVILSLDRSCLENILFVMQRFLDKELRLTMHPRKISIRTIASGVDFLGWVHFPYHRILRTATKKRMFRNIQTQVPKLGAVQSYLGLMGHGNTWEIQQCLRDSLSEFKV